MPEGNIEIARLDSGRVVIGRDPEEGIKVDSDSISRDHGVFLKAREHWLYKDLGSTNGSWINGEAVKPELWRLLRPGDYMQLADKAFSLRSSEGQDKAMAGMPVMGGASLVVLAHDDFVDEYPVPEYGRALVIGGTGADLEIGGDLYELPSLVIERRGDKVCAFSVAKQLPVLINATGSQETLILEDGDTVSVSEYVVIFNNPARKKQLSSQKQVIEQQLKNVKSWSTSDPGPDLAGLSREAEIPAERRSSVNIPFGQKLAELGDASKTGTETVTIDAEDIDMAAFYERQGIRRSSSYDDGFSGTSVEDKVIILIGLMLMFVLVAVIVWWVFI